MYFLWQDLSIGTKRFDPVTLTFDLLLKKKITLGITFEPKQIEHSYFIYVFLMARLFSVSVGTEILTP